MMVDIAKLDKIGILGGSFDPIHYGHLRAAEAVRAAHGLERIMLLPAGNPVFKQGQLGATAAQRAAMCHAVTAEFPRFFVDETEVFGENVTYTIDTLRIFRERMPNTQMLFLLGADAMKSFPKWREAGEILKLCTLIEMPRTSADISSTKIRQAIANIEPLTGLVPPAVDVYIRQHGLYNQHLQGVAAECVALARHYGLDHGDADKAHNAGLWHDNAKAFCRHASFEEIQAICARGGYALDEFFATNKDIAHCYVGAVFAREQFGASQDVADAIASHTFGRPSMTMLEKIVYIADFVEHNRPQTGQRQAARKLAYEDIDKAVAFVLQCKIEASEKAGEEVFPLSREALNFYQGGSL